MRRSLFQIFDRCLIDIFIYRFLGEKYSYRRNKTVRYYKYTIDWSE
jgi:hypothetical protein